MVTIEKNTMLIQWLFDKLLKYLLFNGRKTHTGNMKVSKLFIILTVPMKCNAFTFIYLTQHEIKCSKSE